VWISRNLVGGRTLENAADADICTLGILTKDDEIDVIAGLSLEGTEAIVVELDRSKVDEEVEAKPDTEKNVTRVLHIWHPRVAVGADQYGRELLL
jgi:hypothetical protein